ncbi:guanine-1-methyltransferase-domain-containing protein [Aspergillus californicus]
MEEEERPRKIQKVEIDDSLDAEPLMTGAIGSPQDDIAEHADAQNEPVAESTEILKDSKETMPARNGSEATTQNISKRQLRKQRKREKWETEREDRKVKRKEQVMARKQRKRAAWAEAKEQGKDTTEELRKLFPSSMAPRAQNPKRLPLTLIIDCGFDELMEGNERVSLAQQLTRSYSENNKSAYNAHLVLSSFNKLLKERFETVLNRTNEKWRGVRFTDEDFLHAANEATEIMKGPNGGKMVGPFADKTDAKLEDGEIVYLSSDSSDTLTELKPYSTYIIGGLVDKNRHKGICHRRATELGIRTAKLPIGDYIQMASRSILATNHVVEIMVRWLQLQDWGEAFMKTIPPRKGGVLRNAAMKEQEDTTPSADSEPNNEQAAPDAAAQKDDVCTEEQEPQEG